MKKKTVLKGVIIRNGLANNGSWSKRVKHWKASFENNDVKVSILSAYPNHPSDISSSTEIDYLTSGKIPFIITYIFTPFIILRHLIKSEPDFILLTNGGFYENLTIPLYSKIKSIPLLIDIVDTIGRKYKQKKTIFDFLIILNKSLFDYIVKQAYQLTVISSTLQKQYKKKFPQKLVTISIPTTVNVKDFEDCRSENFDTYFSEDYKVFKRNDIIKIVYAGSAPRLNGIEYFLGNLSQLLEANLIVDQSIRIIFLLTDNSQASIISLINKYNLYSISKILKPVDQNILPVILKHSDILILPALGKETAESGFPGKTAEYLISGRPILTTDFSDLGIYLENGTNACICAEINVENYKDNLLKLILDESFRVKIGSNGRLTALQNFSHINSANIYLDAIYRFYEEK